MFDIRWIRDNPDAFDAGMVKRGEASVSEQVLTLDKALRACQTRMQEAKAKRNELSKRIGALKAKGQDATAVLAEVGVLKGGIQEAEDEERRLSADLDALLERLPNIPAPGVPEGMDESSAVEVRRVGQPPAFDFAPRQHFELGEALGLMDFDLAAKISGARFVVLRGVLARLERALATFMLDLHTGEFGYTEVSPPYLVRDQAAYGTANLPKFAEDLFRTEQGFWLIPTAEMPLTNMAREQILDEAQLPLRFTAYTPCFRSEAGAAGKDTRGMMRLHQFSKVELVSITHPEQSWDEHERMTACAEEVLKRLGLHYRLITLSAGDMSAASHKTYDIEVWLPGQGAFREISSCSNCGEYQARRMGARFRPTNGKGTRYVHSLNGSGLAVGRTLIAVLENYQQADGSIAVPDALRPCLGGLERIGADG